MVKYTVHRVAHNPMSFKQTIIVIQSLNKKSRAVKGGIFC